MNAPKQKPIMDKPKILEKVNILPREAGAMMKERYISKTLTQKPKNLAATNAAANDAIQRIETNTQNTAAYATRAAKRGIKHIRIRRKEKHGLKQSTVAYRTEKKTSQAKAAFSRINKSVQEQAKARAVRKAQKEMVIQTRNRVGRQTATFAKKITAAAAKASAALVKGLIAALGSFAPLIAIIMAIAIFAAVVASPFGLFFSGEDRSNPDTVPISSVVGQLNTEFGNRIEQIQNIIAHDSVVIHGHMADWAEILAVFAVKTASGDDNALMDVVTIDSARMELIQTVFWGMNSLRYTSVTSGDPPKTTLHIYIDSKSYTDMIIEYGFNMQQTEALYGMLEYRDMLAALIRSIEIISGDAQAVIENLPQDLSEERRAVVKAACSLVGKVGYFWGGKSSAKGWDSRWGTPMEVTADGNTTKGTIRLFGLDCSGLLTWTFVNAGFEVNAIGHGTSNQNANSTQISWDSAQPGDLAFYSDLSHVGIVAGRDDSGNILIVHCAAGYNNVVITGKSGFGFAARPNAYN